MVTANFEVEPKQGKFDEYLRLTKSLRAKLEAIGGFDEIEHFANDRTRRPVLSLSTWRNKKTVVRWRTQAAQEKGGFEVFEDHHVRVGEVIADSLPQAGLAAMEQRFDATEGNRAKVVTLAERWMHRPGVPKPL